MLTPNLDKLMEQATQDPQSFPELLDVCNLKRKRDELFYTHGPALVAALKDLLNTSRAGAVSGDYVLVRSDAIRLLTKLDQEA